jgi:hypothetical protein
MAAKLLRSQILVLILLLSHLSDASPFDGSSVLFNSSSFYSATAHQLNIRSLIQPYDCTEIERDHLEASLKDVGEMVSRKQHRKRQTIKK